MCAGDPGELRSGWVARPAGVRPDGLRRLAGSRRAAGRRPDWSALLLAFVESSCSRARLPVAFPSRMSLSRGATAAEVDETHPPKVSRQAHHRHVWVDDVCGVECRASQRRVLIRGRCAGTQVLWLDASGSIPRIGRAPAAVGRTRAVEIHEYPLPRPDPDCTSDVREFTLRMAQSVLGASHSVHAALTGSLIAALGGAGIHERFPDAVSFLHRSSKVIGAFGAGAPQVGFGHRPRSAVAQSRAQRGADQTRQRRSREPLARASNRRDIDRRAYARDPRPHRSLHRAIRHRRTYCHQAHPPPTLTLGSATGAESLFPVFMGLTY